MCIRDSSISAEKVGEIVDKMRKYHLPCDAIHLDIDYMDGYRVFTWRTDTYDDPKKFINKLHKLGLHIITIIDPGVKKDESYPVSYTHLDVYKRQVNKHPLTFQAQF